MEPQKIAAVVNTFNSERTLEATLQSLAGFDQIVVCDMYSEDATREIAERHHCKIVFFERCNFVEPARNYAISQADCPWVLVVDSDEKVPSALRDYLYDYIGRESAAKGLRIPRLNHFMDRPMRSTYPDMILRFVSRDHVDWPETIHATPRIDGPVESIDPKRKDLAFIHNDQATLHEYFAKLNNYTDKELLRRTRKKYASIPYMFFTAHLRFFKSYFLKGGFRDGKEGFIMAYLSFIYRIMLCFKNIEKNGR